MKTLTIPFGRRRIHLAYEKDGALHARQMFHTNLHATHVREGRVIDDVDLGSGAVTYAGTLALCNDFNWANPSGAVNTMVALSNWHGTGTGITGAAASDIKLQTPSGFGGQNVVAGTQTLVQPAALGTNAQQIQTVATIAYTGTEAVTEWGLFADNFLTSTTGSPFTAVTATNGTVTATPLTASSATVRGQQIHVVEAGTTASWGLVLSNSTSVFTFGKWYKTADGTAGVTPGNTETYTIRPVMWDHKVFAALNVINGDSIQFTYTLTFQAGG